MKQGTARNRGLFFFYFFGKVGEFVETGTRFSGESNKRDQENVQGLHRDEA